MNGAQRNLAAMKQLLSNILESRYFCNDVVILKGIVLRRQVEVV
jgi:hypothetical protein